jgi:hypothetical protein
MLANPANSDYAAGRMVVAYGRPTVASFCLIALPFTSSTGEEVDLTGSISRMDGNRVEPSMLEWSPDSKRLAELSPLCQTGAF